MDYKKDSLGDRMKRYEAVSKISLVQRMPVIVRIDGKSFHTFTQGFGKPFDSILAETMQLTTKFLCENIQGCVFGYTQSDEITLILVDYKNLNSTPFFDNEVQKICSICASMATMKFNQIWSNAHSLWRAEYDKQVLHTDNEKNLAYAYSKATSKGAMFDARCFNVPKEDVTNNIVWRQKDAIRNSIQMVGQAYFSHKQLQNKKCDEIKNMLLDEYNINWEDYRDDYKYGAAVLKVNEHWFIDKNMPIITENRDYIEKLINFDTENG